MTEGRYYTQDINDANMRDLKREVKALEQRRGRLVAIVDEEMGGIVAYGIGEDNSADIVKALQQTSTS